MAAKKNPGYRFGYRFVCTSRELDRFHAVANYRGILLSELCRDLLWKEVHKMQAELEAQELGELEETG